MNPTLPNLHTTRLENLGIESYGARFDLDGRTVQIRGDSRTPLVGALQAFHQAALDDYRARQPEPRPGWFSRLRSWIGRIFQAPSTPPLASLRTSPSPPPAASLSTSPSTGSSQVSLQARDRGPVLLRPSKESAGLESPRPATAAAGDPVLRAVYADKDGVHLVWQPTSGKSRAKEVAMTSSLDSQLAQRLQDCYGHLAELGYKVAGLELIRPEAPSTSSEQASLTTKPERIPAKVASPVAVAVAPHPEEGRAAEPPVRHRVPRVRLAPAKPTEPPPPAAKDPVEALPEPGL